METGWKEGGNDAKHERKLTGCRSGLCASCQSRNLSHQHQPPPQLQLVAKVQTWWMWFEIWLTDLIWFLISLYVGLRHLKKDQRNGTMAKRTHDGAEVDGSKSKIWNSEVVRNTHTWHTHTQTVTNIWKSSRICSTLHSWRHGTQGAHALTDGDNCKRPPARANSRAAKIKLIGLPCLVGEAILTAGRFPGSPSLSHWRFRWSLKSWYLSCF